MKGMTYKYNKGVTVAGHDEYGVPTFGKVGSSKDFVVKKPRAPNKIPPGTVSGSKTYKDGTPGIFVKSIKGMPGKHYVEKALTRVVEYYMAGLEGE
ncbi:hypothetical protein D4R86_00400 [bacterium]|nr:MAG: hypothetical protein D4R86_00400 [bacterium]